MIWSTIDVQTAPTDLSWGTMMAYGVWYGRSAWWALLSPAVCLILMGFALISLGYKASEAMNPHVQREIEMKEKIGKRLISKQKKLLHCC